MANPLSFLLDPVDAEGDRVPARYRFTGGQRWWTVPVGVGLFLLAASVVVGLAGGGAVPGGRGGGGGGG